jgi:hypothetical protein
MGNKTRNREKKKQPPSKLRSALSHQTTTATVVTHRETK